MGLVVDSCVFIRASREGEILDFSEWKKYGNAYISTITASELLVGVHLAKSEKIKMQRSAFVESIISAVASLPFTNEVARIHSQIYAYLHKKGNMVGAHDLIIGATAIANGCAVLTYNEKDFKRIPGLKVEKI